MIYRVTLICLLFVTGLCAQEVHEKVTTEVFHVNHNVQLELDASYANVEFATWDSPKVKVEAVMKVANASEKEVEQYFSNWDFEALGNRSKVIVSAKGNKSASYVFHHNNSVKVAIDPLEMHIIESITPDLDQSIIVEMKDLPPLPELEVHDEHVFEFDYEAYKKDGEKYLKVWKSKWKTKRNKGKQEEMDAWRKAMREWREKARAMAERHHERVMVVREKVLQQQERHQRELLERERALHKAEEARKIHIITQDVERKNKKHARIEKKIKVTLPKKANIRLKVRHGEVRLADGPSINATLSHAKLYGKTVQGKESVIKASYTPVSIDLWKQGQLSVDYVNKVSLKQVGAINIRSNSSTVKIGELLNTATVNDAFGVLSIDKISSNLNRLQLYLDNSNVKILLPKSETVNLDYKGVYSQLIHPKLKNKTQRVFVVGKSQPSKGVVVRSQYSNVVFGSN